MPTYSSRSVRKSLLTRLGLERMEERDVPAFYLVTGTTDIVAPTPTLGDGSAGAPIQVASLRSAVALANASSDNDTIILQADSTYQLTDTTNYNLEIADASTAGALTITGAGETATTIQAAFAAPGSEGRIFSVLDGANLTLSNVTLTGGNASAGGAILAYAETTTTQLTLSNVTLTGNSASSYGGAIRLSAFDGGAIAAVMTDVTLTNNTAGYGGALAVLGYGGAVTATLTNATMSGNTATVYGGAVTMFAFGYGGVFTSTLTNSTVSENTAVYGGGGISVSGYGGITLTNSTVSGNTAMYGSGGGIAAVYGGTLAISNSTISGNTAAAYGGGIAVIQDLYDGELTVTNSTVSGNRAGFGGGVAILFDAGGANTLTNSTVSGNIGTYGGGGLLLSSSQPAAPLDLVNSTVSGNSTNSYGGGIAFNGGDGSLLNSTVTRNLGYGGGVAAGSGTVEIQNAIVAGNFDPAGTTADDLRAHSGTPFVVTYSLIGATDGAPLDPTSANNLTGTVASPLDPRLGALANNGGPTRTHALLANSPARNTGNPNFTAPTVDQRGQARVLDGRLDVGAFEAQTITVGPGVFPTSAAGRAYTATLTASGASGPFAYIVTAGALPPGLTLSPTGELAGTPTASGTYTFTVGVTGAAGADGAHEFSLTVAASATPPKFVLGAGSNGRIQIAGVAGTSIPAFNGFQGEVRVATADLNGDGVLDVIAGAGAGASGGHVKVFDGSTGAEIRSFFAFGGYTGGVYVSTGDINGDGVADIIVGAGAGASGGHVKVFDGKTGDLVRSFFAFDGFAGGARVASGDVNGDGVADIIVGAGAGASGGHVKVFDGKTGDLVRSFFAFAEFAGGVFVGAADLDGDGTDEILAGADAGADPQVRVFGATNMPRLSFLAYAPTFRGGVRVAGFDVNGDGWDEIITGSGPGAAGDGRVFDSAGQLLSSQVVPDTLTGIFVG
ncbi:polymorphic outer membrane protein : Hemolysin-type calcium-binding region domain protein OS=Rhodopirellula maiorica SM1 GN=RMSM_03614 PE=4 SV=1: Beta_helix: VCBS [Gemmata massiliana]|uniref:Right handed beta helix domain-containing protein n=1 Tax=Gemmata massiliana TaxID=1210884 RepID=A0A6P2CVT5_9BACT|nr:choice-of-anchor Q domain-containing protein [Gemmata massiliana]VTR92506.1 polymorphic outer membrane protein : Hemolysin-type calcium-binding region domain protein OS=Rhodopirellula maiorica SM1 GN=RMSM_03614 PE=4 SV=1: Beta_helix: VCBS [Gemmata massiliana]